MPTQTSLELTSTIWSPVTARPTWAPTLSTPGSDRSSRLTCVVIWVMRGLDVPGSLSSRTSTSLSLNEGISEVPRNGSTATATTTARARGDENRPRAANGPRKRAHVARRQPPQQRGLGAPGQAPGEEQDAQGRRQGQRDDHRGRHRQREREHHGLEEGAGTTLHDRDRNDRQERDERCVSEGASHLVRGLPDDVGGRPVAPHLAVLAQAPRDVLPADDGVVDDDRDGDREPGERDRVEGLAEQVEHERGRHQRHRDRDEADEHRAPLEEEGGDDQCQQHAGDHQDQREVVDRVLDQGRGPEHGRVRPHTGQTGLQLLERLLDAFGHIEGVGARELLDDEQQALAIVDDRVTDQRLVVDLDVRDVG